MISLYLLLIVLIEIKCDRFARKYASKRDRLLKGRQWVESEHRKGERIIEGDIIHDEFVDVAYGNTPSQRDHYVPVSEDTSATDITSKAYIMPTHLYTDCPNKHYRGKRAASLGRRRLWNDGIVFYDFEYTISLAKQAVIKSAMEHWELHTCIRFQPRYTERDYLSFYNGPGCFTTVGKSGGRQGVSVNDGCMHVGTMIHEVAHTLGFWHEHSRPDRDSSVDIMWSNIIPGREQNFNKMNYSQVDSRGAEYDYNSIMHYGPYSFSKGSNLPTIVVKNTSSEIITMGQRSRLSYLDITQAKRMYCCPSGACYENPCQRGRCEETTTHPFYQCMCFDGWYGANCSVHGNKCVLQPCANNGVCIANNMLFNGFECLCELGYSGPLCELYIRNCGDQPCLNGGSCSEDYSGYSCECPVGFSGDDCEFLRCPDGMLSGIGVCTSATGICVLSNPCAEHGSCVEHVHGYECVCLLGYSGRHCQNRAVYMCDMQEGLCAPWQYSPEGDFNWTLWAGLTPSQGTGPETDHTTGTSQGYYLYTESSEVDSWDRAIIETGPLSKSEENCVLFFAYHMKGSTMGTIKVNIKEHNQTGIEIWHRTGHQGNNWQTALITVGVHVMYKLQIVSEVGPFWKSDAAIDDLMLFGQCGEVRKTCVDMDCGSNAMCITYDDGLSRCKCKEGYGGTECDEPTSKGCLDSTCNNGICKKKDSEYECECFEGFEGEHCQNILFDCKPNQCNNGTCSLQSKTCDCNPGYSGRHCNIPTCTPNPCHNNGTCVQLVSSVACVCTEHYHGTKCEVGGLSSFKSEEVDNSSLGTIIKPCQNCNNLNCSGNKTYRICKCNDTSLVDRCNKCNDSRIGYIYCDNEVDQLCKNSCRKNKSYVESACKYNYEITYLFISAFIMLIFSF